MEIRDSEKRRARNLIWNAAEEYGFEPDFKVYDETGQADLYWNSIIGTVPPCPSSGSNMPGMYSP